jgi:hypothetical protein
MNNNPLFSDNIWCMISQFLEPHQRFQLIQVNKWFQQITKKNKLNYTMVSLIFSNPSDVKIYYESQETILNRFLKRYKALLPWINSNNVELNFLTAEEFQKFRYDHSSNFSINMLILNYYWFNITTCEQLKIMLSSLRLTILSLENCDPIILNDSLMIPSQTVSIHNGSVNIFSQTATPNGPINICSQTISILNDLLDICSGFSSLRYLQVNNFEFPHIFNLEQTYFKSVIFNNMYFHVTTCVHMPLCLEKFHMDLDLLGADSPHEIEFRMNQCKYIKEL